MRGAIRWLSVVGLLVLGGAFASSAQAAGGSSIAVGGATPLASPLAHPSGTLRPFLAPDASPLQSTSFGGQTTFVTGSSSASATFHVPKIASCTSDSGLAPGAFIFAGPTTAANLDGAGVIDQCVSGARTYVAALVVDGLETNFPADKIKNGDVVNVSTSVGTAGSAASLTDVTKGFTESLTGSDSAADQEIVGIISTSFNNVSLPIPNPSGASFTAAKVGGTAMGTQSPFHLNMVNGCQVIMAASGFDSATHEAFKVTTPHLGVTSLTPGSATAGTAVTIDGFGFNGTTAVKFGAGVATAVTHTSSTAMTATVPTTATTGPVTVTNTAAPKGTQASACTFTVTPKITSFTPANGITGSQVTITGSGFKGSTGATAVKFGDKGSTSFTVNSATQIKAVVPNGASPGPITVITKAGNAVSSSSFTPTLSITEIKPASGPVGTTVALTGVGFNSSSTVSFGGTAATNVKFVSSTAIHANVPAGLASGTIAAVTVHNTTGTIGTVQAQKSFTVTPSIAPTVTSFTPTSGPVGTSVTITGSHFSGAKGVKFGTVAASTFKINSDTSITATVPAGAVTGKISVTTAVGTGTSATSFTVT